MNQNRTRLVSFRVSPDEMENLRVACLLKGARNVSEFARSAVLESSGPQSQQHTYLLDRFSSLELRMSTMQSTIQQTQEMLQALAKALAKWTQEKTQAKEA